MVALWKLKGLVIFSVKIGLTEQNWLYVIGVCYSWGLLCKMGHFSIRWVIMVGYFSESTTPGQKAKEETCLCNSDNKKLWSGGWRDICRLWKAQSSTNNRSFTRHSGTITGKHDTCHNGAYFQLNSFGKVKNCPLSVKGLITSPADSDPLIKFKSPKARPWNTMLTANFQFLKLNMVKLAEKESKCENW